MASFQILTLKVKITAFKTKVCFAKTWQDDLASIDYEALLVSDIYMQLSRLTDSEGFNLTAPKVLDILHTQNFINFHVLANQTFLGA